MFDPAQVTLTGLYRYPVKGLSPEPLAGAALAAGQTVPGDRRYAIANGPLDFDPAHPRHFPKIRFLMLMRDERLAALRTCFDDTSSTLRIAFNNAEVARGDLSTATGRTAVEDFFAANFTKELKGPPKILEAPGHSFSDVAAKVVSIVNLASVSQIEDAVGQPVDPLRFRANLYVRGWPAWHELELMGREMRIGGVRLRVTRNIVRCAATNVDPVTTERDMNIPKTLMDRFGHAHCGVYAEVIAGGEIAPGDRIEVL
ncbi:MOSC domain-containing protein [[Pseudomonas] carboxydohydrogena]|uniref:MOSC domain-containing protein n=1 Tax=Afipia carboxydohydrogena TaxID=290 RepID=A0ABY8BQG2_AFICR|nr:MOSC domain-containing protein [[Pseudomonas] carboxydohydrogena]WEF52225.1 MOSC domain-containing protein [[Pseudomonas] carboxydohydrogena]